MWFSGILLRGAKTCWLGPRVTARGQQRQGENCFRVQWCYAFSLYSLLWSFVWTVHLPRTAQPFPRCARTVAFGKHSEFPLALRQGSAAGEVCVLILEDRLYWKAGLLPAALPATCGLLHLAVSLLPSSSLHSLILCVAY